MPSRAVSFLVWCCLTLVVAPGLSACSAPAGPPPPATQLGRFFAFPADRGASTPATGDSLLGTATDQRSPGASDDGTALLLAAAADGVEYAVYRFDFADAPDKLDIVLGAETTAAYIGLANYATQQWEFSGPYSAAQQLQPEISRHVSSQGNLYVAVVAWRGATVKVEALHILGWSIASPSPDAGGTYPSLAVVDGNPAFCHCAADNGDLRYVRASDASGTTWNPGVAIDAAGNVNQQTSLAVIDGNPAIAYSDTSNGVLKYVRAMDASGSAWGLPQTLDSTDNVGGACSLAVVAGCPAVSYGDYTIGDLKFVRAQDAAGAQWNAPQTLDSADFVGQQTSLEIVDGNPAISYYNATQDRLCYIRASQADGGAWGTPVFPDNSMPGGEYSCLVVVAGQPAISYYNGTGQVLYVRASDAAGSAWGPSAVLANAGNVASAPSLVADANGAPAISYYDFSGSTGRLRYLRARAADGSSWDLPFTLDDKDAGSLPSLAVIAGQPAICYYDGPNLQAKYMRLN